MFPGNEPKVTVVQGYALSDKPPTGANTKEPPLFELPMTNGQTVPIPDGNCLVVGGTGQGKTVLMSHAAGHLLRSMTENDMAIILDVKGSFEKAFARDRDLVINSDRPDRSGDGWNILEEFRADAKPDDVLAMETSGTMLEDDIAHSQNPYFPMAAGQEIAGSLELLAATPGTTNQDLVCFWQQSLSDIHAAFGKDPRFAGLIQHISQEGYQTQGVRSYITDVLKQVFIGKFSDPGTLSLRKFIREKGGRTIFLHYQVSVGTALAPLFRVMADLILKEAIAEGERALAKNARPGRVYLILDEIRLLPRLHHLEHALNLGREYGLRVVLGLQSSDQLRESYRGDASSLLAGCANVFAFNVFDGETRDFVKRLFGRNRKRLARWAEYGVADIKDDLIDGFTVEDWEILKLRVGECIVRTAGNPEPFLVHVAPPPETR